MPYPNLFAFIALIVRNFKNRLGGVSGDLEVLEWAIRNVAGIASMDRGVWEFWFYNAVDQERYEMTSRLLNYI